MPRYEFTATHGVRLADGDGGWVNFTRALGQDRPGGAKVYRFTTDSAAVARRLRKVDDYGITEVSSHVHGDDAS